VDVLGQVDRGAHPHRVAPRRIPDRSCIAMQENDGARR
jgi:hypothetical protein